ncbi:helicase associated domain-containing protein, partial [Magnetococcales bacterium HHB-1]
FQQFYQYQQRKDSPLLTCPEDKILNKWIRQQREQHKKETLLKERAAQLSKIGFIWDVEAFQWQTQFQRFRAFYHAEGHGEIPTRWPQDNQLAQWAEEQRKQFKANTLKPERQQQLEQYHFIWDLQEAHWQRMFKKFLQFIQQQHHSSIPEKWPPDPTLADWAREQRRLYRRGRLKETHQSDLEHHGFIWDLEEERWQNMYQYAMNKMQTEETTEQSSGLIILPLWSLKIEQKDPQLSDWAKTQRRLRQREKLSQDHQTKLNQLSFIWDPDDYLWQKYYLQLKHYIQKFGHDHIPRNKEPWTTLETWLRQQRQSYQRQKLSKERVTQLNALPIHWQAKEAEWQS